jgi:hypothetical protein
MTFDHHTSICTANSTCPNDAHCLALQQVADKQVWQPALVFPCSHEIVSFYNSATCSKGEGKSKLCCGLCEDSRGVTNWDAVFCGFWNDDIVVADGVIRIGTATSCLEGTKEVSAPVFRELANDTVAFISNEFFDGGVVEDGLVALADFDASAGGGEDLEPAVAREILGDDDSKLAIAVVDLCMIVVVG